MYGWVWRHLPGPFALRAAIALLLAAGVVAVCFGRVFPAVADRWEGPDRTVVGTGTVAP